MSEQDEPSPKVAPPEREAQAAAVKARQRQNFLVLLLAVGLLAVGGWLVDKLLTNRRIQNCIEARHRDCVPLDLPERR